MRLGGVFSYSDLLGGDVMKSTMRENLVPKMPQIEMPKNTDHQLLIIGNGFDISCGLRSRFSDFFEGRILKLEAADNLEGDELVKFCADKHLTVWDLILASRHAIPGGYMKANWCDVEFAIAAAVLDLDYDRDEINPKYEAVTAYSISEYLYRLAREGKKDEPKREQGSRALNFGQFEMVVPPLESFSGDVRKTASYLRAAYPSEEWDKQLVLQTMLAELHKLENEFRTYMAKAVNENEEYCEKSFNLLSQLIDYGISLEKDTIKETTVLDFNYTTPPVPSGIKSKVVDFFNVHGKIDSEIVFGIDGTGHMDDFESIQFTKTYRLLGLRSVRSPRPIAYGKDSFVRMGKTETVAIKFFGHSLSSADYSYFQSVFDIVGLYDSDVKLYFFFRNYADGVEDEMFMRVTSLLSAYGETMENKDHGKNLVHKLILEGRLAVVSI